MNQAIVELDAALATANERIRELEAALNDAVSAGDNAYQHMLNKESKLAAEREVSDKLVAALEFTRKRLWSIGVSHESIDDALTNVAAIRAKQGGEW